MDTVIRVDNISKRYKQGSDVISIFENLSFELVQGEQVAIVGVSGVGKSTFLHILAGLDMPTEGQVFLMGHSLLSQNERQRSELRRHAFGFIYQFHHLLPEFTALENVAMPLRIKRIEKEQAFQMAREILTQIGLSQRLSHLPSELSGGERQRVAIARALVHKPHCILADEPTGNLDYSTAQHVFEVITSLAMSDAKPALVVVTHDKDIARHLPVQYRLVNGQLERER